MVEESETGRSHVGHSRLVKTWREEASFKRHHIKLYSFHRLNRTVTVGRHDVGARASARPRPSNGVLLLLLLLMLLLLSLLLLLFFDLVNVLRSITQA